MSVISAVLLVTGATLGRGPPAHPSPRPGRPRTASWDPPGRPYTGGVPETVLTAPVELERPETDLGTDLSAPWVTIVWNDPVNLMSYVTYVFRTHFGYSDAKAEALMMDVHSKGRAAVSTGSREQMERDVEAMHEYGLWATLQKDD
jgi:ATP-dependent Clp protease adaptor protein ClpS